MTQPTYQFDPPKLRVIATRELGKHKETVEAEYNGDQVIDGPFVAAFVGAVHSQFGAAEYQVEAPGARGRDLLAEVTA